MKLFFLVLSFVLFLVILSNAEETHKQIGKNHIHGEGKKKHQSHHHEGGNHKQSIEQKNQKHQSHHHEGGNHKQFENQKHQSHHHEGGNHKQSIEQKNQKHQSHHHQSEDHKLFENHSNHHQQGNHNKASNGIKKVDSPTVIDQKCIRRTKNLDCKDFDEMYKSISDYIKSFRSSPTKLAVKIKKLKKLKKKLKKFS